LEYSRHKSVAVCCCCCALAFTAPLVSCALDAAAVESGFGVHTLGAKGPGAGIIPPPGTYLVSQHFIYSGQYDGLVSPVPGALLDANVKIDLSFNDISAAWILPGQILGGHLGVGATLPVGYVGVDLATAQGTNSDSRITIGDPLFGAFLGWHWGSLHWNVGATVVAPIGDYDPGRLANLSLNRPALDLYGAATWLDTDWGLEYSLALGITFNGENTATDYESGREFHTEWAVMKSLTPQFSLGVTGYHYEQLSEDQGAGARLGSFEGRATAIGAAASYNFSTEEHVITVRLNALHEFRTRNRFSGTPIFLSIIVGRLQ
jgi:hypothetical protein